MTISNLEKELNIEIFQRKSNGIIITEEGAKFIQHAKDLVEGISRVEKMSYMYTAINKKGLSISTQSVEFINFAFMKFYKYFTDKDIDFMVKETYREKVVENVKKFISEIGFLIVTDIQMNLWNEIFSQNNLEWTPVIDGELVVYIDKNNPIAQKDTVNFEDLRDYTNISYDDEYESALSYTLELSMCGFRENTIDRIVHVNNPYLYSQLMKFSNSYILGIKWDNHQELKTSFKCMKIEGGNTKFTLGWLKRRNYELSEEGKMFLDEFYSVVHKIGDSHLSE